MFLLSNFNNKKSDIGSISILPRKKAPAESWGTWRFIYVVGKRGISPSGGIRIHFFDSWGNAWDENPTNMWSIWQNLNPQGAGYLSVNLKNKSNASLNVRIYGRKLQKQDASPSLDLQIAYAIEIKIQNESLSQGDKIEIIWGDTCLGSPGTKSPIIARHYDFYTAVDAKGTGKFEYLENHPYIEVIGQKARHLHVCAPSIICSGESIKLKIAAHDQHANLDSQFSQTVSFKSNNTVLNLPDDYTFTEFDNGHQQFNIKSVKSGLTRVKVSSPKVWGMSNPVLVTEEKTDLKLFWGEIHNHTRFSDAVSTVDECYEYGKDIAALDFGAVADHNWHTIALTPEKWAKTIEITEIYNTSGEFVTLIGHECQIGQGHANIYYRENYPGLADMDPSKIGFTISEIHKNIGDRKAILVPHHLSYAGMGFPWDEKDDEMMPIAEIYSIHGASEYYGNPYSLIRARARDRHYQTALEEGYKIGVIAGSDLHEAHLGSHIDLSQYPRSSRTQILSYRPGLAAVYAHNLTRTAIWDALAARSCYGTTGARIILKFEINGYMMGQIFKTEDKHVPRELLISIAGTAEIERVDIVKNNFDIATYKPVLDPIPDVPSYLPQSSSKGYVEGVFDRLEVISKEPLTLKYCDEAPITICTYYYIRVTQKDGHMAWSSPIWVETL